MLNSGSAFGSGSYYDLRGRVLQRLRLAKINDELFSVVENAYEKALAVDNLVLSRVEKKRLLADVLKSVLADMNRRLDEG